MNKSFNSKEAKRSCIQDRVYMEFDSGGNVVYHKKFRHEKACRFTESNGFYAEYDEFDRKVFHIDSRNFWCFSIYSDPYVDKKGNKIIPRVPYQIIHKYWNLYNNL